MTACLHNGMSYADFLRKKSGIEKWGGIEPKNLPACLFDFQAHLTEWAVRKGQAALFESCGLGKTPQELACCEQYARHMDRPALIVAPLAVSAQIAREADKFGFEAKVSRDGSVSRITITNYERLHHFRPEDFCFVAGDEIQAIKAFDGKRRRQVTRFFSHVPYRLAASATPAPNDFIELGTVSEAIGVMTQSEMLAMFFRASDKKRHSLFKEGDFWNRAKWFFKPHSETPFWRWVCSWARAIRSPEDLGFDGSRFALPPLNIRQRVIDKVFIPPGELFPRIAATLAEQREERKRTLRERCEKVAELVDHDKPAVVWCQYNAEGDLLEKIIPGAVQVAGRHSDDEKESRLLDFSLGNVRVLVTKPRVASLGLNWQHCGHQTFFPSHSYEQWIQAISRSLRFGRVGPVDVDIVTTPGEAGVTANLEKKQKKADQMFSALVREMQHQMDIAQKDGHVNRMEVPSWL